MVHLRGKLAEEANNVAWPQPCGIKLNLFCSPHSSNWMHPNISIANCSLVMFWGRGLVAGSLRSRVTWISRTLRSHLQTLGRRKYGRLSLATAGFLVCNSVWCVRAELLWRNPQFGVTLTSPDPDDRSHVSHMVVSLMQESLRSDQNFSIGAMIYKVNASIYRDAVS